VGSYVRTDRVHPRRGVSLPVASDLAGCPPASASLLALVKRHPISPDGPRTPLRRRMNYGLKSIRGPQRSIRERGKNTTEVQTLQSAPQSAGGHTRHGTDLLSKVFCSCPQPILPGCKVLRLEEVAFGLNYYKRQQRGAAPDGSSCSSCLCFGGGIRFTLLLHGDAREEGFSGFCDRRNRRCDGRRRDATVLHVSQLSMILYCVVPSCCSHATQVPVRSARAVGRSFLSDLLTSPSADCGERQSIETICHPRRSRQARSAVTSDVASRLVAVSCAFSNGTIGLHDDMGDLELRERFII
jgi:hypothetical protein